MVRSAFLLATAVSSATTFLEGSALLQVARDAQLEISGHAAVTIEAQLESGAMSSASNAIRAMEIDITKATEAKASAFMKLYTTSDQARQALNIMKQAQARAEAARESQAEAVAGSKAEAQKQLAILTRPVATLELDDDQEEAEDLVGQDLAVAQALLRERVDDEAQAFAEFAAATRTAIAAQKVAATAASVAAQADDAEENAAIRFACKSKELSEKAVLVQSGQKASMLSASDPANLCEDTRASIMTRRAAIAVVQEKGDEVLDEARIGARAADEAKAYTQAQAAAAIKVGDKAVKLARWSALAVEAGEALKLEIANQARVQDANKAAKDAAEEARATETAQMAALENSGEGEYVDDVDGLRKLIGEAEANVAAKSKEKADAFVELHASVRSVQQKVKAAKDAQLEAELATESEEEAALDAFQKGRAVRHRAELAWKGVAFEAVPITEG